MRAAAIVPSAGKGERMHAHVPKVLIPVMGRPMLAWTLEALQACGLFSEILVACPPGEQRAFQRILDSKMSGLVRLVGGGATRQDSVANCIAEISSGCELAAVHDGARPLVTETILRETLQKATETGAAIAAVPCKDTVKVCDERGIVRHTLERECLCLVQTPQCFHYDVLLTAYEVARKDGVVATDDSALVERLGFEVHVVNGSYENIKVTTPEDLLICEEILRRRRSA